MAGIVLTATERSILQGNMPTAAAIQAALRGAVATNAPAGGAFVGPAPRVTRVAVPGAGFDTTFAWLYAFPATSDVAALQAAGSDLSQRVTDALAAIGAWGTLAAVPYNAATHGSAAWWTSATGASATHTRNEVAAPGGSTILGTAQQPENPTGPDTPAAHPATLGALAQDWAPYVGGGLLLAGLLFLLVKFGSVGGKKKRNGRRRDFFTWAA